MARRALLGVLLVLLAGCGEARNEQGPERPALGVLTLVGDRATYPPGAVRPGDKIVCKSGSVSASAIVPGPGTGVSGIADGVESSASLEVDSKPDGTVVVRCDE
jgi:hypothetical protein